MTVKIKVETTLLYDNEIQFADACDAIADKLMELRKEAMEVGDHEQFIGQTYPLMHLVETDEQIGTVKIVRRGL